MGYVVRAVWNVKPGRESAVRAALAALAAQTRSEPGNQLYLAYAAPETPLSFNIFEIYDDEAAFEAHVASPHFELYGRRAVAEDLESRSRETFELFDL
jgi:quinol monooxygenase YgiN